MKNRSSLIDILFVFFIISLAVIIAVRGKRASLAATADRQNDVYVVKPAGYYDTRSITGADGPTDIPTDRVDRNPYSAAMMGEMRGISTTSSTMVMP